jgi:hypothetical protein
MVGHQAVGMPLPTGLPTWFGERFDKILPIKIIQVNALSPLTSAHDMVHCTRVLDAQLARHVAVIRSPVEFVNLQNEPRYGLNPGPLGGNGVGNGLITDGEGWAWIFEEQKNRE